MNDFELGYVIAMIEGEGSVMLINNNGSGYKLPVVQVTVNSDRKIVDYVAGLLQKYGFKPNIGRSGRRSSNALHVRVRGKKKRLESF
jgi:hypothetical protein